jgi:hypothetical protein
MQRFRRPTLYALALAAALALVGAPAVAASWSDLTPAQQEALAPLSKDWDKLADKDQRYYLRLARRYPALTPIQQKRMRSQLAYWSKLTPEQRERARQNYRAFHKVPPATREKVEEIAHREEAEKAAAGSAPARTDPQPPAR